MKEELHWYYLVQYVDQEGFETRKEFIRINRSRYRTDNGCWKTMIDEIFEKKEDYEDINDIVFAASGWEEKGKFQLI